MFLIHALAYLIEFVMQKRCSFHSLVFFFTTSPIGGTIKFPPFIRKAKNGAKTFKLGLVSCVREFLNQNTCSALPFWPFGIHMSFRRGNIDSSCRWGAHTHKLMHPNNICNWAVARWPLPVPISTRFPLRLQPATNPLDPVIPADSGSPGTIRDIWRRARRRAHFQIILFLNGFLEINNYIWQPCALATGCACVCVFVGVGVAVRTWHLIFCIIQLSAASGFNDPLNWQWNTKRKTVKYNFQKL